jgi:hypothetical protein
MSPPDLLRALYAAGVEVRLEGDRVHLVGTGPMPPALSAAMARIEADVLALLRTGSVTLQAPLSTFATLRVAVEVHVPGLADTLWFASDAAQVDRLLQGGIRRGRIWTPDELARLWAWGPPSHEQVLAIAKGKLWSNGVLTDVEMQPAPPAARNAEPAQAALTRPAGGRQ